MPTSAHARNAIEIVGGDRVEIAIPVDSVMPGFAMPTRVAMLAVMIITAVVLVYTVQTSMARFLVGAACGGFIVLQSVLLGRAVHKHVQRVVLSGGEMIVTRSTRDGRHRSESYLLAEVHDLRVLSDGQAVRFMPVMEQETSFPHRHGWPERIAFTYHGSAHSIGGDCLVEEAQKVVDAIAAYDAQQRADDGRTAEPNVTTFDTRRFRGAASRGFDLDHPLRRVY